jgi:hypothetical protein
MLGFYHLGQGDSKSLPRLAVPDTALITRAFLRYPFLMRSTKVSIVLQDRDIGFLRGLFESRVMTASHASSLYFDGRHEMTKKRLQKLKSAGLIAERPRRAFEPAILYLTRKGLGPLVERGILRDYPEFDLPALERRARVSGLTLRHELEVMEIKVAFASSVTKSPALALAEFNTWPLLNEFKVFQDRAGNSEVLVRPDGFIRIHEKEQGGGLSEHALFLEVDRSTESQEVLASKAACYLAYYKTGGFAEKCGGNRGDFKEYPFRVLFVFKTAERRNNTAERLIQGNPPILTQVWLTTFADVTADPFGAIWIRPADYRDAIRGTRFEHGLATVRSDYSRDGTREQFIESSVKKNALTDTAIK